MHEELALRLDEMSKSLRDCNRDDIHIKLKEVANDARVLSYLMNPKASTDKDILSDSLYQLAEDLDECTVSSTSIRLIIEQLKSLITSIERIVA